ncbi:MAG: response regulator transcription factor [Bacteroidota bacterium]
MSEVISIGLVDDHRLFRIGLATVLNANQDMQVVLQAENGHQLLQQLKEQPLPDVILLDLEMPVMDGMQTMIELRKVYTEVPVLLLTMHQEDSFVIYFMESGANGFLFKDAHPDEVDSAIRKVVNGGFYFNDAISAALLKGLKNKPQTAPSLGDAPALAEREIEVLKLICMELNTQEIADKMFLSPRTIEGYRKKLLDKTGAKNTAGLVMYALKKGVVNLDDN